MNRGRFISFEGIDGAGKSTHISSTATRLRARGLEVVVTRAPCRDGMSGSWHALSAAVVMDGRILTGCAHEGE